MAIIVQGKQRIMGQNHRKMQYVRRFVLVGFLRW